jgi:hypothetical protein
MIEVTGFCETSIHPEDSRGRYSPVGIALQVLLELDTDLCSEFRVSPIALSQNANLQSQNIRVDGSPQGKVRTVSHDARCTATCKTAVA